MGKKIQAEMDAQRASFVEGAAKNGVEQDRAVDRSSTWWRSSPATASTSRTPRAYALVAYQTACLKANHPVEFIAASMTLDIGNTDKLAASARSSSGSASRCCRPTSTAPTADFTVETTPEGKQAIRYALAAVKGVGATAMDELVAEREANGPFKDLFDFAARLDPKVLNKRQFESLAKAGAFDTLNKNRAADLRRRSRRCCAIRRRRTKRAVSNQVSLFGDDTAQRRPPLPKVPDWPPMERLQHEFDAIGFYLSAHPLDAYGEPGAARRRRASPICRRCSQRGAPGRIKLAGTVDRPQGAHLGQGQPLRLRVSARISRALSNSRCSARC